MDKNQTTIKAQDFNIDEFNALIIDSIQDIKGKSIVKLDLRHLEEAPADFFIICQGDSTTQVKSIADNVYGRLKREMGELPINFEGTQVSEWVLVDYFITVVHVFHPEKREFYQLEDLWSDAIVTEYEEEY